MLKNSCNRSPGRLVHEGVSYSLGDGLVTLALAAGIVGYLYVERRYRIQRLQILHAERMKAMEQGIPLVEIGEDREGERKPADGRTLPLIGLMLLAFAVGAMIVMFAFLPIDQKHLAVAPLPVAFMGLGLLWYHLVLEKPRF